MKKITFLLIIFVTKGFSQWGNIVNSTSKLTQAIGEINFNYYSLDSLEFRLFKTKGLEEIELNFSINGSFFNADRDYYVLFEISDRKYKASKAIVSNYNFRVLEFKDLISDEKYEVEDFIDIIKSANECRLTIRSRTQVIQGYNILSGIAPAFKNVLLGRDP